MDILKTLAEEFKIKEEQVKETVALIDEGNTIPFISRYRKEVTGGLDDATLRDLNDRLNYLRKMDERREEISNLIDAQGKLTPEITFALNNAKTLVELEDIYLPYRPKRKLFDYTVTHQSPHISHPAPIPDDSAAMYPNSAPENIPNTRTFQPRSSHPCFRRPDSNFALLFSIGFTLRVGRSKNIWNDTSFLTTRTYFIPA